MTVDQTATERLISEQTDQTLHCW